MMGKETDEILAKIEDLPDGEQTFCSGHPLDPLAAMPIFITTGDLKALAAEFREMRELLDAAERRSFPLL